MPTIGSPTTIIHSAPLSREYHLNAELFTLRAQRKTGLFRSMLGFRKTEHQARIDAILRELDTLRPGRA